MKKIITFPTIGIGNRGGDRVLIELANRLAEDGHLVNYLYPKGMNKTDFPICPKVNLLEYGFQIKQIEDLSSFLRLFFLFFSIPKSDIIFANYYLTAFPVAFFKIFHPKTMCYYLVQHYEPLAFGFAEKTFPKLKQWLAEKTYTFGFTHICVANWIKARVDKLSKKPGYVFSPGINHDSFLINLNEKNQEKESILIFPGNDEWKGWKDFIQAIPFILEEFPNIEIIASSKDESSINHQNIKSIHPKNDEELADLYRAATIYVHPAWWEGCPLAPLEAMACGTPVVAARSEGVMEYANHFENCYLVNVKDPLDLSKGIIHLLKDKELQKKISNNGLATARNYTWDRMYETIKEVLFL
jgi:glycosyltransferase involved in cell wall biosynthesis